MCVEDVTTVAHVIVVLMMGGFSATVTLHGQGPIVKVRNKLSQLFWRYSERSVI